MTEGSALSLKGKIAFISGASKGIGVAIAEAFAEAGADLALAARDEDGLNAVAATCSALGAKVSTHRAEMGDAVAVKALAHDVLVEWGRIDILVNNAGLTIPQSITDLGLDEWNTTMNVNLLAPVLLAQAFAPGMVERGHGKIINVASRAGLRAIPNNVAYCASKAGIQMVTKSMAVEFGPHGVQSNCISPTVILTPMGEAIWTPGPRTDNKRSRIPAGRFGEAHEVADLALFLASPKSDFLNGTIIPLDGGEGAN
ncbi:MAG: SDR family oxidoreductase [Chloroflexi bacterium]|nr:SDR family oxidoreductase [Chloroflexota bacterium]